MDNRGYAGTTELRNCGNWLRFATPRQQTTDNGQRTTDNGGRSRHSELRINGITELRKLASLCYAGQQTTDNGQRTTEGKAGSLLKAHNLSLPSVHLYTFYPLSTFAFSP